MKKILLGIVALALVGGVIWLSTKEKGAITGSIKIGAIFALSGDAAAWGEDELNGTRLAIDEANASGGVNGKQVQLIVEDAPGTTNFQQAVSAFRKLAEIDKVSVIIGPSWDDPAHAIAPLTDQAKIVVISPDVTTSVETEKDYPYLFLTWTPLPPEMGRLASYAKSHKLNKIAILHNTDPFSSNIAKVFIGEAKNLGLDVSQEISIVDTGSKDFRTAILKIKNQKIDALYMEFADAAYKCPFLKQARELGLSVPILSTSSTQAEDLLNKCGTNLEGVIYAYQKQGEKTAALLQKYKAAYHSNPVTPAYENAYDATNMIIDLMRQGKITSDQLREGLLKISNYSGAIGDNISFDAKGDLAMPASSFIIKTVKNGAFTVAEE